MRSRFAYHVLNVTVRQLGDLHVYYYTWEQEAEGKEEMIEVAIEEFL